MLHIVSDTVRHFIDDNCMHWAAALSFYTILSLVPILLLTVSIAGLVLGTEETLLDQLTAMVRDSFPYISDSVISHLHGLIKRQKVFSWFAIIVIIWWAEFLLKAIHDAMIPIFGITHKRGLLLNMVLSWGVFFIGTAVVVFSIAITMVVEFLHKIHLSVLGIDVMDLIAWSLTFKYFLPLAVMVFATSVALKVLAGSMIKLRDAIAGGIFFAVFWEIAKHAFTWYVAHFAGYNMIYGSLGALMIVLIWIFYSFNIFLFSAEIASVVSISRKRQGS